MSAVEKNGVATSSVAVKAPPKVEGKTAGGPPSSKTQGNSAGSPPKANERHKPFKQRPSVNKSAEPTATSGGPIADPEKSGGSASGPSAATAPAVGSGPRREGVRDPQERRSFPARSRPRDGTATNPAAAASGSGGEKPRRRSYQTEGAENSGAPKEAGSKHDFRGPRGPRRSEEGAAERSSRWPRPSNGDNASSAARRGEGKRAAATAGPSASTPPTAELPSLPIGPTQGSASSHEVPVRSWANEGRSFADVLRRLGGAANQPSGKERAALRTEAAGVTAAEILAEKAEEVETFAIVETTVIEEQTIAIGSAVTPVEHQDVDEEEEEVAVNDEALQEAAEEDDVIVQHSVFSEQIVLAAPVDTNAAAMENGEEEVEAELRVPEAPPQPQYYVLQFYRVEQDVTLPSRVVAVADRLAGVYTFSGQPPPPQQTSQFHHPEGVVRAAQLNLGGASELRQSAGNHWEPTHDYNAGNSSSGTGGGAGSHHAMPGGNWPNHHTSSNPQHYQMRAGQRPMFNNGSGAQYGMYNNGGSTHGFQGQQSQQSQQSQSLFQQPVQQQQQQHTRMYLNTMPTRNAHVDVSAAEGGLSALREGAGERHGQTFDHHGPFW